MYLSNSAPFADHPGYPHIELYPPVSLSSSPRFVVPLAAEKALEPVSLKVAVVYPVFDICKLPFLKAQNEWAMI